MVIVEARTIELKNIGTVVLERSRQAKHLSLSVRPFKGARVAVPFGVSFASAEMFARSKAGWLKKHLDKMALMEREAEVLSKNQPINIAAARKHLIDRLNFLSQNHGFDYNRVFIKNSMLCMICLSGERTKCRKMSIYRGELPYPGRHISI